MIDIKEIASKKYYQYAQDCVSGKQVCCKYTKLACQRFLEDLNRNDISFIPNKVDRVILFVSKLKHFKGKSAGQHFILEPWQEFIVANLYGFYREVINKKTGETSIIRRFSNAYIEMARKQGKTALIAALGLYALIYDHESGAECILAATSREQAGICFELCKGFAKSLDPMGKYLHIMRSSIEYRKTMSVLKIISSDSSKQDGFNASFGVLDELHAHPSGELHDVIKSSMGFRKQPFLISITTAGFDLQSFCYRTRTSNIEILNNIKQDDSRFCIIYTLDEGDDYKDEENWIKCSPNLDITVSREWLRDQMTSAKNNPAEEVGVLTKNFNIWCNTSETWIQDQHVQECMKGIYVDFANFKECMTYIGIDLSSVSDISAVSFLFDKEGELYFKNVYFIPEECMASHSQKEYYKLMAKEGYLIVTPGNVIDYDYIKTFILRAWKEFDFMIQGLYYDRWNSTSFTISMEEEGMPMVPFSQSLANFNAPTKELQKRILSYNIHIDTNLLTLYMFRNVVIKRDHNDNCKPDKSKSKNKIDGVIAMIEALGGYMIENHIVDVF